MRIVITGGAGCLGSNLLEHWLPQGHDILVIDNFATGRREVVPGGVERLYVIEGTIADPTLVDRVFDDFAPTHVVHAAASYKDPDDWGEDAATNVLGSIHVVQAAKRLSVRRFVNLQTALCYGRPERVPIPVEHPCRPVASYGVSKTAGEEYVALSGLPFVSLRLASVIGPRLAIGAIPTFYTRLKAGKAVFCTTAVRDFLDMSDFLAFMDLAMNERAPTGVYNLGPGVGHSIRDVLVAVAAAIQVPVPSPIDVRPVGSDDVETVVLDPAKTEAVFGWRRKVTFDEAITKMVRWYDQFGVSAIHTHLKVHASPTA
jgi:nucleoside-diphosphate-sugar epimerase